MAELSERSPELAAILSNRRDEIGARWLEAVRRLADSPYLKLTDEALASSPDRGLRTIIETLSTGSALAIDDYLAEISRLRLRQGFGIGNVMEGLLLLREAALPVVQGAFPPGSTEAYEGTARFESCVRHMLTRFSELYAEEMRLELLEHHKRADLMLRVVQTASGSLELDQVLERVAEGMVEAVRLRYCGIYLIDPEDGTLVPRAAAGDLYSIDQDVFRTHRLDPRRDRLFAEVLETSEPAVFHAGLSEDDISQETVKTFGLKSVLAVPIEVGGRPLGVALVATFKRHHPFSPEEVELARGVANATALAVENARLYDETRRRLAETQSLQRVAAALLEKQNLAEVLDIVCVEARRLTGAEGSAVFLLEEDEMGGEGWLRVAHSNSDADWPSYEGLPVDNSFTGMAVRSGTARLTNSPADDPLRVKGAVEPDSLLAVPLTVKGVATGALDIINKPGGFAGEDVRIMSLFADQAAIAIENTRLRRRVEQLAVVEERQRLARDLHDSVNQSLYSMGLFAEATGGLIVAGNYDRALDHVRQLREAAHDALKEMRLLIFELRPPAVEEEGIVAALQARLDSVETRGGLQCKLLVEGDENLPTAVEEEFYRIALEALNNALKHSRAQRVTVLLHFWDDGARMEIADDGKGFSSSTARSSGGLGLKGMRERARRIGARLEVESSPGNGTTVVVELGNARPGQSRRQDDD